MEYAYTGSVPNWCDYITPGKRYPVTWGYACPSNRFGRSFNITDDHGDVLHCLEHECEHIGCKDWSFETA